MLYDQSFNAQLTDTAVQTAIQQARAALTGAGANSISGPNPLANNRTLTGTTSSTVVNSTTTSQTVQSELTIGPGTILIGDRGLCASVTAPPNSSVVGCSGGTSFTVLNGTSNVNTNANTQADIFQTVTTTSTFLTSQTYELNGTAAPAPPATPAPPSLWLTLTGGAAARPHCAH